MDIQDVVSKIKKLLALSTSSNANEAALAASKAAALMQEYQIEEAALQSQDPAADNEPVEFHNFDSSSRKKVHWRMAVAAGCARVTNCHPCWTGSTIQLIGRKSDVQAARYLYDMIAAQVEDLAERCWNQPGSHQWEDKRRWMHAFRLGCGRVIQNRLIQQHHDRMAQLKQQTTQQDSLPAAPTPSQGALMVIDRRLAKVKDFVAKVQWAKPSSGATLSSSSGFQAGREAGHKVNIGGASRGALSSPKKAIR